ALARTARGLHRTSVLRRDTRRAAEHPTRDEKLTRALRGSAVPRDAVRLTSRRVGAAVIGLRRPVIVLEETLLAELSVAELRAVLEHEDAHRRRRDPARTLLRQITAAVFFPFPFLVPLNRRLAETAEYAADEHSLRAVSPEVLARALARVASRAVPASPSPAFAERARGSLLSRRFRRLETSTRRSVMPVHRVVLAAAAAAVLAASFTPRAAAHDPAPAKEPAAAAAFDEAPRPLKTVPPVYPEPPLTMGEGGVVRLSLVVDEAGLPTEIRVVEGVDAYPELERAAVEAVKQWTFHPATADGVPVKAQIVLPVRFDPEGC
ncbi:MAG: M56 family metallopeptidase, partial [Gemmatimonadetes bacterium]|nr:M56 family metallopeptidase [Gemmatimonadota bacterium]